MDRDNYTGLYTAYLQMYTEGTGKGKLGSKSTDYGAADKGAATGGGGGRSGVWTPATGAGANKRHKNNTKGDDNRMKTYKDQLSKDKVNERGISPEARKERARQNKDNTAKKGIDSLLKDIRGK